MFKKTVFILFLLFGLLIFVDTVISEESNINSLRNIFKGFLIGGNNTNSIIQFPEVDIDEDNSKKYDDFYDGWLMVFEGLLSIASVLLLIGISYKKKWLYRKI